MLSVVACKNQSAAFVRTEQPISLRFLLGEFCLYTRRFSGITLRAHFDNYPEGAEGVAARTLKASRCDVVYLPAVPCDTPQSTLTVAPDALRYVPEQYPLYYVVMTGTFEEYMGKFSGKSRRHQRQAVNKLSEHCAGEMSVREYRRPEEMGDFQRTARVITELTYQERLLRVGLPATAEFLRKLVREAEEDNVRSYVLFHADRPIAFAYCSSRGRNLTYQVIGYDPDYRNFSPGRVLLYLMLEALFREGRYDKFDFGAGEAFYKSFFATDSVQCMDVYYFRPTARNWFTLQARTALVALSRALVRISESLHIKDTLKKWLREKSAG